MTTIRLDYETRSPLDIKKTGSRPYLRHPSAEIILLAFQVDDSPIYQWDFSRPDREVWEYFEWHMRSPAVTKMAFNAPFEMQATEYIADIPVRPEEWICSMAWAYARAFTGSLSEVGKAIGLSDDKQKRAEGTRLITRFCVPPYVEPEKDPERWEKFRDYNRQDVVAERAIADYLAPFPLSPEERDLWVWDREVNDRGLPVDLPMIESALTLAQEETEYLLDQIGRITGLANPNSRDQLLGWLKRNEYPYNTLRKEDLERVARDGDPSAPYQAVVALRLAVAKASTKKYVRMSDSQINGRIHDTLQIWGAGRTGRWGGRGIQVQNLARPEIRDPERVADWLHDGEIEIVRGVFG